MSRWPTRSTLLAVVALAAWSADARPQTPPARVEERPFDSTAATRLPHRGAIVAGRQWRDSDGEHTLLLTQTGKLPTRVPAAYLPLPDEPAFDAEVYGYHYTHAAGAATTPGGAARLVWRTADFERGCQFDLYAGYLAEAVTITDLDRDGVAETTFLYTLACRSDVSPATRKLIMHEGAAKYAIRGTTAVSGDPHGGRMVPDAAFAQAPPSFRTHAVALWKRYVAQDGFEQF
jgi:hypothetical protein